MNTYSNDLTQIKQGFVNYIGALLNSTKLQPKAARQQVVSILSEEILDLIKEKDYVDVYIAKYYIRSIVSFLNIRLNELETLSKEMPKNSKINNTIEDYKQVIEFFKHMDGGE